MSKSILILYDLPKKQLDEIEKIASDYTIVQSLEEAKPENVEIILGWSEDVISFIEDEESQVKWIQYPFAGVNNLPLELFDKKDITLTNGSGIHTYAVTESTMGLLLGMTRNIITAAQNKEKEEWVDEDNLYELHGKTMMIVGAGKIGVHLGQVAQGFGMKTIGINRSGSDIENTNEQYVQDELPEVIDKADIVVNILPATKQTHHLFNEELFGEMKDQVIFINVGRGETVDTEAMLAALDDEKILFAGLDVFEEEPLPKGHPIWSHERIAMTPHIAGRVEDYPKHFYPLFKKNLEAYLKGETLPENVVEIDEGY
jgi:phosphoglycerate dehydrogenase-like enzyme